jgi:hypothetical protein
MPKNGPHTPLFDLRWEQVNEVTWKLYEEGGEIIRSEAQRGKWGGSQSRKALAWVIQLAPGWWAARWHDKATRPTSLSKARRAAEDLQIGRFRGTVHTVTDPVAWLNHWQARAIDHPGSFPEKIAA